MPVSKPWITNHGRQQESGSPSVDDLYISPNVFVNGQAVVLAGPPAASPSQVAIAAAVINNDDVNPGTPTGYKKSQEFVQSLVTKGAITQEQANQSLANIPPPVVPEPVSSATSGNLQSGSGAPVTSGSGGPINAGGSAAGSAAGGSFNTPIGTREPTVTYPQTQTLAKQTVLVLLFRGLLGPDPSYAKSSVEVDATASVINEMKGYRAKVFNHEQVAAAFKEIQATDQVILYGFSAGGNSVLSMLAAHPSQKFALALTLDCYPKVNSGMENLPANCTRGVNWFNPNWGYLQGIPFPKTNNKTKQIQDPSTPSNITHFAFPKTHLNDVITEIKSIIPQKEQVLNSTVNSAPQQYASSGSAGGTGKITSPLNSGSLDLTQKISKYFTLGDIINKKFKKEEDYSRPLVDRPEIGMTAVQIRNNLSLLAQNVLDPIIEKYPDLYFTSTQRPYEGDNSMHPYGLAADIKFNNSNYNQQLERAIWIRDNLPYNQVLLETTHGVNWWIHVDYSAHPRPTNYACKWGTGFNNKQYVWLKFVQSL